MLCASLNPYFCPFVLVFLSHKIFLGKSVIFLGEKTLVAKKNWKKKVKKRLSDSSLFSTRTERERESEVVRVPQRDTQTQTACVCVYIYTGAYIYIYIYIRERERERRYNRKF